MRYLLVTHIPFRRASDGAAVVDALWAEDLRGLAAAAGQITVAAPDVKSVGSGWGTGEIALTEAEGIRFHGLPSFRNAREAFFGVFRLRRALEAAVREADLVHSSNFFPPYLGLAQAHRTATRLGKKTLFVVAEDFVDFLTWNEAASGSRGLRHGQTLRLLGKQDTLVRECLRTASVAFLHTPAAVARYRLDAPRGMAIRQPVHEAADVISAARLAQRLAENGPLRLVAACRLEPLKGLDFLLRALSLLTTPLLPNGAQERAVTLDVYGGGCERQRLLTLIEHHGLGERVRLHDSVPPGAAFREVLARHDAAVMPHLTSDFGRAFWDAVAAGLPVAAFRSPAADDTVRHREDGLLAPMADVHGLADALRTLAENGELRARMSWTARERALGNTKAIWNRIRFERIREEFPEERGRVEPPQPSWLNS